jgi:hypothetical protein
VGVFPVRRFFGWPRLIDTRLLSVFVFGIAAMVVYGVIMHGIESRAVAAEHQTERNCELINVPIKLINSIVDQLESGVATSTVLPPATKAARIKQYDHYRHALVSCSK